MSEGSGDVLPKHELRVVPRAKDISPVLLEIIEDLFRLGRESDYAGMIICAVFEKEPPFISGDLSKVGYHQAMGLCTDITDQVKAMYEDDEEESDEESGD